jgi:Mlc titration factor MtfA (ptsG expression regulator)
MLRSLYRQLVHRSDDAPPPCPEHWAAILAENVGHYRLLSEGERARLCGDAQAFVAQKFWEGCGGLDVTEEMQVTIAGQVCLSSGTPALGDEELARRWHRVLAAEQARLAGDLWHGHRTFLGEYAGTSKAELIAVASERFFTVPGRLMHYHPELYDVLAAYYRLDPTRWFAGREEAGWP